MADIIADISLSARMTERTKQGGRVKEDNPEIFHLVINCLAIAMNEITCKYHQELWPTITSLEFRNQVKHEGYLKA